MKRTTRFLNKVVLFLILFQSFPQMLLPVQVYANTVEETPSIEDVENQEALEPLILPVTPEPPMEEVKNLPPELAFEPDGTLFVDDSVEYPVKAVDPDGDSLEYTLGVYEPIQITDTTLEDDKKTSTLPSWISLVEEEDRVYVSLQAKVVGVFEFVLSVTDGVNAPVEYIWKLEVEKKLENLPPSAPEISLTAVDGVLHVEITKDSIDPDGKDGDELTYEYVWMQDGVILAGADLASYTPVVDGLYTVEVTAVNAQDGRSDVASTDYNVVFPVIDLSQISEYTFVAGESYTVAYVDSSETVSKLTGEFNGTALTLIENGVGIANQEVKFTTSGKFGYTLRFYSLEGFVKTYTGTFLVVPGMIDPDNSVLIVSQNGKVVTHVETGSDPINVELQLFDSYKNSIDVSLIDRVEVKFNGTLASGQDYVGDSKYKIVRQVIVPQKENLSAVLSIEVIDDGCALSSPTNVCLSRTFQIPVYSTVVDPVYDLTYVERTNEGEAVISGRKVPGYGLKLNMVSADYAVKPNESSIFQVTVPLAEGTNEFELIAVKNVDAGLVFYSSPVRVSIEKDTNVGAPLWGNPAIVLSENNSATLYWTDPIYLSETDDDFSHVNIYRSTVPNFVPDDSNLVVKTHNPSWTDANLTAGMNYYYVIEAVDTLGNSSFASGVRATGQILGGSTIRTETTEWDASDFGGKGDVDGDSTTNEEEKESEEEKSEEEGTDNTDDTENTEKSNTQKVRDFFSNLGSSIGAITKAVFNNVFVKICLGGILLFFGLILLASVLIWLKEKLSGEGMVLEDSVPPSDEEKDLDERKKKKKSKKKNK